MIKKAEWQNVRTEFTSYAYNMREAMLRLANTASDTKAANAKAKDYFVDINDVFVGTQVKDQKACEEAYARSVADLNDFKALVGAK